jgi:hypothetical protein
MARDLQTVKTRTLTAAQYGQLYPSDQSIFYFSEIDDEVRA